jgi:hypothetical protein
MEGEVSLESFDFVALLGEALKGGRGVCVVVFTITMYALFLLDVLFVWFG